MCCVGTGVRCGRVREKTVGKQGMADAPEPQVEAGPAAEPAAEPAEEPAEEPAAGQAAEPEAAEPAAESEPEACVPPT